MQGADAGPAAEPRFARTGALQAAEAVHLTQVQDKTYLPSVRGDEAVTRSSDCGIAATVMALRYAGLDVPGAHGERRQSVLDDARRIATGRVDRSDGTNITEWMKLVRAGGGAAAAADGSQAERIRQALEWAAQGLPVVISGNPADAWNTRIASSKVTHFDGAHAVMLTMDPATGDLVINDPLSHVGPFTTTADEVRAYMRGIGNTSALAVRR